MKKLLLIFFVFVTFTIIGIYSRLFTVKYTSEGFFAKFNVGSYYAQISQRLIEDKRLPRIDTWRYSNEQHVENAPPFLAYTTSWFYLLSRKFNIKILDFIALFNIIIFVITNIIGSIYLYKKFQKIYPPMLFIFLSSFLPYIAFLHRFGGYTEEGLGIFLIFLISIFEMQRRTDKKSIYFETLFLTLLLLTWQQFHIILLIIFLSNLFFDKKRLKETLVIFTISIFVSEIITRYIFQSNYSPLGMVYEAIYPLLSQDKNIIKTAMRRSDWAYISWENIFNYLSYPGIIFSILALINYYFKKNKEYQEKYLFIGLIITCILASIFIKSRYLTIPYLLLFCAFNYEYLIIKNKEELKKIINFIIKVIIILTVGFLVINYRLLINFNYNPVIETKISSENISDKKTKVTLVLKNVGGNQTPDEKGFAGFHIEVFNAKVTNIKSNYSFDKSTVVKKTNAKMKDYYWFETKFNKFDKNNYGEVTFFATKIDVNKPIKIEYRSWIPGYCSLPDRLQTMFSLLADYSGFENSWRNEKCIVRNPKNEDKKFKTCSYKVYAAHIDKQEFRCIEEYLK